jgi:hypothetical protein
MKGARRLDTGKFERSFEGYPNTRAVATLSPEIFSERPSPRMRAFADVPHGARRDDRDREVVAMLQMGEIRLVPSRRPSDEVILSTVRAMRSRPAGAGATPPTYFTPPAGGVLLVLAVLVAIVAALVAAARPSSASTGGAGAGAGGGTCAPLAVALNPTGAPPGARETLAEALRRLSDATGIPTIDLGLTNERPASDRTARTPASSDMRRAALFDGSSIAASGRSSTRSRTRASASAHVSGLSPGSASPSLFAMSTCPRARYRSASTS